MNVVQEVASSQVDINENNNGITPFVPLAEWSVIAVLFVFLIRSIWISFANKMAADTKMLNSLVDHIQETNGKLIEHLETEELIKRN